MVSTEKKKKTEPPEIHRGKKIKVSCAGETVELQEERNLFTHDCNL